MVEMAVSLECQSTRSARTHQDECRLGSLETGMSPALQPEVEIESTGMSLWPFLKCLTAVYTFFAVRKPSESDVWVVTKVAYPILSGVRARPNWSLTSVT